VATRSTRDTVFQLASVSKPLSATVVAQQVGVNAIGWGTPIVSKLPWFALSDPVSRRWSALGICSRTAPAARTCR